MQNNSNYLSLIVVNYTCFAVSSPIVHGLKGQVLFTSRRTCELCCPRLWYPRSFARYKFVTYLLILIWL